MQWEEKKATEFKFQENGSSLVGRLEDAYESQYGMSYNLTDPTGAKFYFFGSAQLDRDLDGCIGKVVSITFKGMRKTKNGHPMKDFDVKFWNEENGELPEEFEAAEST